MRSTIVHGDFRLGNLIYDKNNKSIRGCPRLGTIYVRRPIDADFGYMLYPFYIVL